VNNVKQKNSNNIFISFLKNRKLKVKLSFFSYSLFFLILLITLTSFYIFSIFNDNSNELSFKVLPLTNSVLEIKYKTTKGHLYFEEAMSGDEHVNIEKDVYIFWKESIDTCQKLKTQDNEKVVSNYSSKIDKIDSSLINLLNLAKNRYKNKANSLVGSDLDQQFDKAYEDIMILCDNLNATLEKISKEKSEHLGFVYKFSLITLSILFIISAVSSFFISLLLGKIISQPIEKLTNAVENFTKKKTLINLELDSNDEIGTLSEKFTLMTKTILDVTNQLEKEKASIEVKVKLAVAESEKAKELLEEKMQEVLFFNTEFKQAKEDAEAKSTLIQKQQAYIKNEVEKLVLATKKVSEGDLTINLTSKEKDDLGTLTLSINQMISDLNSIVSQERVVTNSVLGISNDFEIAFSDFFKGAEEQSFRINEIASAITEMGTNMLVINENISFADKMSNETNNISTNGLSSLKELYTSIMNISNFIREFKTTIEDLSKSSKDIVGIIEIIEEIASQTNLLSLNAAIESARAGEAGRGFAVVANEIKKLSDRTINSTKQIKKMVENINSQVSHSVKSIASGSQQAEGVVSLVTKTEKVFDTILNSSKKLEVKMQEVTISSHQQIATHNQIERNITLINEFNSNSVSSLNILSSTIKQLNELINDLNNALLKFRTN
jgi:methyl-accepting chemotaxis protein